MTTKREFERRAHLARTLQDLGFTAEEVESLRRISNTLRRWHEQECGTEHGAITRDEKTGRPFWYRASARYLDPQDPRAFSLMPDREAGAKKRLAAILARRNSGILFDSAWPRKVSAYIQTDPRGAALYILRPGDVPEGEDAGAYYNRGICVY